MVWLRFEVSVRCNNQAASQIVASGNLRWSTFFCSSHSITLSSTFMVIHRTKRAAPRSVALLFKSFSPSSLWLNVKQSHSYRRMLAHPEYLWILHIPYPITTPTPPPPNRERQAASVVHILHNIFEMCTCLAQLGLLQQYVHKLQCKPLVNLLKWSQWKRHFNCWQSDIYDGTHYEY